MRGTPLTPVQPTPGPRVGQAPAPVVAARAPRTRFGTPDFDAIYLEIQDAKREAREGQTDILRKLDELLDMFRSATSQEEPQK